MDGQLVFRKATLADVAALNVLVNGAYRGESSKAGWTTEADLLDGQRTDEQVLESTLQTHGNAVLLCLNDSGELLGCVLLQQKQHLMYLGMQTVQPQLQARGLGKQLMTASES